MTIVVPRLGWSISSTATRAGDHEPGAAWPGRCACRPPRRASRSATHSIRASLASSDGWTLSGPTPSQRVAPLTLTPTPGHEHQQRASASARRAAARPSAASGGSRPAARRPARWSDARPRPPGGATKYQDEPVSSRADDRRRRQHHHQAEQVEHGDRGRPEPRAGADPGGPGPAGVRAEGCRRRACRGRLVRSRRVTRIAPDSPTGRVRRSDLHPVTPGRDEVGVEEPERHRRATGRPGSRTG